MVTAGAQVSAASPIDPFRRLENGRYRDEMVSVVAAGGDIPTSDTRVVRTLHFELWRHDWQLVVRHRIPADAVDDALTTMINSELFTPGWVTGSEMFERIFTVVVLTSAADPLDAWMCSTATACAATTRRACWSTSEMRWPTSHRSLDTPTASSRPMRRCWRSVAASDFCPCAWPGAAGTVGLLRVVAER